ncbi:unnamed protein product, partial [Sphacelaria rigidula]
RRPAFGAVIGVGAPPLDRWPVTAAREVRGAAPAIPPSSRSPYAAVAAIGGIAAPPSPHPLDAAGEFQQRATTARPPPTTLAREVASAVPSPATPDESSPI